MSDSTEFCKYLPKRSRRNRQHVRKIKRRVKESTADPITNSFLVTPRPKRQYLEASSNKVYKLRLLQAKDRPKIIAKDYNIFNIDTKIQDYLSSKISTIPELHDDLIKVIWIIENGEPSQRIVAKTKADMLRKRIQDLESTLEFSRYLYRTSHLLERYRSLLKMSHGKSFVSLTPTVYDPKELEMQQIIDKYLCIAQDYVEIERDNQVPKKMICTTCKSIDFEISEDDDSIYNCSFCGTEVEIMDEAPSFRDTDRVNMSSKYVYTRKGHFIDAMKRFQGIQNTDPQKIRKVVESLKQEMIKHNLTAERGLPNSVSKDHLYMFLSECKLSKLSKHYDDINLLYSSITGERCPDISMHEAVLLEEFDLQETALKKVKNPNRKNSQNVNYKLYKLLQRQRFPCKKDSFYILKTKTKEDEHDERMKLAWDLLGWQWIPT